MTINYIRVDIEPWYYLEGLHEFRVTVDADGLRRQFMQVFPTNDFESRFDFMMEAAKRNILKFVMDANKPESKPECSPKHAVENQSQ